MACSPYRSSEMGIELQMFITFSLQFCFHLITVEPTVEFRSLFMATVDNIDWPRSRSDSVATQRADLLEYLDIMNQTHMNAIMFQARTSGDALYYSQYEPWSK
jgi:uncharacterized lipoprotein YddW (UPF0748 family)